MARLTWAQTAGGTWNGANRARSTPVAKHGHDGGGESRKLRGDVGTGSPTGLLGPPGAGSAHTAPGRKPRVARGGTQGGLNGLTHALPRDNAFRRRHRERRRMEGGGNASDTGRRGPMGRRLECAICPPAPLLWTRRSTPSLGRLTTSGRTDKNLCRCFGAPACRVFPDHT
jgi:hypothetical protein